jgi:hypothetical protein
MLTSHGDEAGAVRARPHAPSTTTGWSSWVAVLGAGRSSLARAAVSWRSSPSRTMGWSLLAHTIHDSVVELIGGCARAGLKLVSVSHG